MVISIDRNYGKPARTWWLGAKLFLRAQNQRILSEFFCRMLEVLEGVRGGTRVGAWGPGFVTKGRHEIKRILSSSASSGCMTVLGLIPLFVAADGNLH